MFAGYYIKGNKKNFKNIAIELREQIGDQKIYVKKDTFDESLDVYMYYLREQIIRVNPQNFNESNLCLVADNGPKIVNCI